MSDTTVDSAPVRQRLQQPYFLYLLGVGFIGAALLVAGLLRLTTFDPLATFLLLLGLAGLSQVLVTTTPVGGKTSITYDIHNAISIAAVPQFGPNAAVLIVAIADSVLWLAKPAEKGAWKRSKEQLFFNVGMHSLSAFLAGQLLLALRSWLLPIPLLGETIPWLLAAIAYSQLNLLILIGIVRLQHGKVINPGKIWRENLWASFIDISLMAFGGGILAFAARQFGPIGIVVFYLPVLLSAFSFRLYVQQMQAHMDNLEAIIADRTQALSTTNQALQDLMREKDSFLAVLTHDMKSPLTSISIYAHLLESRPEIILEKPHLAGTIRRSQETLLNIVNNILDLEKLQTTGSMPLHKEHLELIPLLEGALEGLRAQALDKQIEIQWQCRLKSVTMSADPGQIERVFTNLVSNAVKYTPTKGHITITLTEQNDMVCLDVADTGYGIPAEDLPAIFDRFRRVAKHERKAAGTGLGLAITKAIVEAHDGTISVSSIEGAGSTFSVRLPALVTE